jgi:hypothetical protein
VAEERGEHRRSNFCELYDTGDNDFRQWFNVPRGRDELGWDSDEQRRDIDGQRRSGGANDHHGASKPDSHSRTDGYLLSGCGRNGTAQLPMAEERSEHCWSSFRELYGTGDNDFRQWFNIRGSGDEHRGSSHQRSSNIDCQRRSGGTNDHHPASKPDSHSRTDR